MALKISITPFFFKTRNFTKNHKKSFLGHRIMDTEFCQSGAGI
ncbi:hypothetical protein AR1Y2_0763 [Anaerostipes rhamnosivorans]|uniref:Uncharacterized protein n=1 Tax=Anaerostipes rhamnosivorans TaxID=1229621 RepID=A0A4P8ICG4_9FIRM|nr:hypothetical protein AR1Y2_0763 [Anaerostipes rhamnosivorans]